MGGGGSRTAGVGREGGGERKGGGAPEAESPPGARGEVVGGEGGRSRPQLPTEGPPSWPRRGGKTARRGGITGLGARRGREVGSPGRGCVGEGRGQGAALPARGRDS